MTSITAEGLLTLMEDMTPNNSMDKVLKKAFPDDFKDEEMYYLHTRVTERLKSTDGELSIPIIVAQVIREENVTKLCYILAMYGWCHYHLGRDRNRTNNRVSLALEKLAQDILSRK